jgi:hypothetical protein
MVNFKAIEHDKSMKFEWKLSLYLSFIKLCQQAAIKGNRSFSVIGCQNRGQAGTNECTTTGQNLGFFKNCVKKSLDFIISSC